MPCVYMDVDAFFLAAAFYLVCVQDREAIKQGK